MIVTVDEVKTHLRIEHNEEDEYIEGLIKQAQAEAEDYCRVSFEEPDEEGNIPDAPEPVRLAVILMTSFYYENRDIPDMTTYKATRMAFDNLLYRYDDLSTMVKEVSETDPKTGEKKLIMYVYLEKYKIPRKMQDPNQNQHFMVLTAEEMAEYSEIRLGVPEEYQTIWVQGQQITKASEQMNEYFFWSDIEEKMWDFTRESTDGKVAYTDFRISSIELIVHNQMYAIACTVPEWQPWVSGRQIELTDPETILWALSGLREAGIQIDKPNPYESLPNDE